MPAHRSYHLPAYRQRQRERARGNPDVLRRINEARRVQWTDNMLAALLREYLRGRGVEFIAEEIGVARSVLEAEMNRLNLPRGRWVTVEDRREAVARLQSKTEETVS